MMNADEKNAMRRDLVKVIAGAIISTLDKTDLALVGIPNNSRQFAKDVYRMADDLIEEDNEWITHNP